MPTRPPREPFNALVLAALAVAVTGVLIAAGGGRGRGISTEGDASWQGLAGAQRPRVAVGQRVIVVLKTPAVADRVGDPRGLSASADERRGGADPPSAAKT